MPVKTEARRRSLEAEIGPRQRSLDVDGLMERLSVNEAWVRRAVNEKRIPYYKVGRLLRFDADEIERWLGRQRHAPDGE